MPLLTRPVRRQSSTSATAYALLVAGTPRRLALARTGVGAAVLIRPRALPTLLGIDSATASRMAWSTRMLGAREVALGLGTLAALRSADPRAARLWIAAGVLCDAVDVLAVGGAAVKGRLSRVPGGAAAATAATAVLMGLRTLREDPPGAVAASSARSPRPWWTAPARPDRGRRTEQSTRRRVFWAQRQVSK